VRKGNQPSPFFLRTPFEQACLLILLGHTQPTVSTSLYAVAQLIQKVACTVTDSVPYSVPESYLPIFLDFIVKHSV
jgi:hypothetical protein